MFILKWLTVAFMAMCALGLWLVSWKRMSAEKKEQRIYSYLAATMVTIAAILSVWILPS